MNNRPLCMIALVLTVLSTELMAAETTVTLYTVNPQGAGEKVGLVRITETPYGLLFQPSLKGLPAGIHGFHVHEKPACGPTVKDGKTIPGGAAGGHYDPDNSAVHLGPYADGHRGDLPALVVNQDGVAEYSVLAPRLKHISEISRHALMVHVHGDNYSDNPAPLGGGGARMLCGIIR